MWSGVARTSMRPSWTAPWTVWGAAALAVAAAVAACHRALPTPRERVLAALPGDAIAVAAADGRALAHPRFRKLLDRAAARWPASLGCVFDAAIAGDAVAVAVDHAGNATAAIALPGPVRCAPLSQRAPGLWIATLGAGPAAASSALDDPRFARARPYLTGAPVAAAVLGDVHVLAAAQPDPLDAWAAIDVAGGADPVAGAIAERIAALSRGAPSGALGRLRLSRPGPGQIVVRLTGPIDDDLASALDTALAATVDAARPEPPPAFACPPAARGVECTAGRFRVGSLAGSLAAITADGRPAPVVVDGSVAGLRLAAAVPPLGLEAGDVVVAIAGRLVTSRTLLADWIAHARIATTVTIRRGTAEIVLEFAERDE
jgi:hypothetical protein